jgi:hypothetical protein
MKVDDDDRDYRLPDDTLSNVIATCLFWAIALGLVYPAWLIGSPWGWFVYAGTFILLCGFLELRSLTNILVRTLPALRLLWMETERLRHAEERRLNSSGHERGSA